MCSPTRAARSGNLGGNNTRSKLSMPRINLIIQYLRLINFSDSRFLSGTSFAGTWRSFLV